MICHLAAVISLQNILPIKLLESAITFDSLWTVFRGNWGTMFLCYLGLHPEDAISDPVAFNNYLPCSVKVTGMMAVDQLCSSLKETDYVDLFQLGPGPILG